MANDKKIEEAIVEFVENFNRQLEYIKNADLGELTRIYKQILYISILDTLSKSICNCKNNRKRFVILITNFSNWDDADRVSILYLNSFLKKLDSNAFNSVLGFLENRIKGFEHRIVDINEDPLISEFDEYDLDTLIRSQSDKKLEYFRHANLFYNHRNSLIHELGANKINMSIDQTRESPHYLHWSIEPEGIKGWDLAYPLGFYELLCKNAVENVKIYFLNNPEIDPFSAFEPELILYQQNTKKS